MLAFFESKKIQIQYQDENLNQSLREIDPHFLLVNWPVWYVLGWDYLRSDVRVFRIDRIASITVTDTLITRRPRSIFLNAFEEYFKSL
jgi:predicted DNA-binding transcriptional regulator YafY